MKVDPQLIIEACANSSTMSEASENFDLNFQTFRKYAQELGVWKPNPGGRGTKKPHTEGKVKYVLEEILNGHYPSYSTYKLKKRLIEAGFKKDECELCGISNSWNGKTLSLQLDHIDGNHKNHALLNLRVVCPNCHSQTETFGNKKRIAQPE